MKLERSSNWIEESTARTLYVCAQEREPVARLSSDRLARRASSDFLLFSRLGKEREEEREKEDVARSLNFWGVASWSP